MTTSSKYKRNKNSTAGFLPETVSRIWLAGLGALARARQEGGKLFETLIEEGEEAEALTRQTADDMLVQMKCKVETVRSNTSDKIDRLEQAFQDRVARALGRLGVPTNDDFQEIARRIEALNDSLRQLSSKK
ncbi:MAG: phasin family protein [Candidatus Competibacteraceae bacterium]